MATTIFNKPIDTEVNDLVVGKMDKPTNAGTANQILRNNGNGGSEWINNPSSSEIGTAVTSWLNTNVPTGTTVAIDRSLTIDGAAANSQTVGNKIAEVESVSANRIYDTISNQTAASFPDGAEDLPMKLKVGIEPVQSGSGDPAPSNIRPITGWTGAKVTRTGKNIFDGGMEDGSYNQTSGAKKAQSGRYRSTNFVPVKPDTTYCFSVNGVATSVNVLFYDRNKSYIPNATYYGSTFTTGDNAFFITFFAASEINSNKNQIELGSTATDYESYQYNQYNISFPNDAGNVYGGILTVNQDGTGTLVVDRANISSYNGETLPGAWISDRDIYISGGTPTTGAQVVYVLASSVSYSLTVPQVKTLLGGNSIWADTGNIVSTKYAADTKLYVDKKIMELQDLVTSSISNS